MFIKVFSNGICTISLFNSNEELNDVLMLNMQKFWNS